MPFDNTQQPETLGFSNEVAPCNAVFRSLCQATFVKTREITMTLSGWCSSYSRKALRSRDWFGDSD